jgi:hypothetical protein
MLAATIMGAVPGIRTRTSGAIYVVFRARRRGAVHFPRTIVHLDRLTAFDKGIGRTEPLVQDRGQRLAGEQLRLIEGLRKGSGCGQPWASRSCS